MIGVTTDFLFPLDQQEEIASVLRNLGRDVQFTPLASLQGHDSFLVDMDRFSPGYRRLPGPSLSRSVEAPKKGRSERLRDLLPDLKALVGPRLGLLLVGLVLIAISRVAGWCCRRPPSS